MNADGTPRKTKILFMIPSEVVKIETKLEAGTLMTITAFKVEALGIKSASLKLKTPNDVAIFNETIDEETNWKTVEFDLGQGVIDVNEIILEGFPRVNIFWIRHIFLSFCLQTSKYFPTRSSRPIFTNIVLKFKILE